ncbi:F-box/kelch-repeat protein At3g06240-like [Mercurialis annua]|uniref:F-box/kelch-repeat protein At3g06240-like n=1 Tax=Mercurialis annua TaxID=3986 RepID=UPI0024AD3C83|nr:F-box/kelch-repeat protein At3g06240-like [Mercurialis annua]
MEVGAKKRRLKLMQKEKEIEIPDHVFERIILNLPWKTVVGLKRLSKHWNSVISSPRFVRDYLGYDPNHKFCLVVKKSRIVFCALDARQLEWFRECHRKRARENKVPMCDMLNYDVKSQTLASDKQLSPSTFFPTEWDPFFVTCCCDGIMCIALCDRLFLWNPKTCQHKMLSLPDPDNNFPYRTWEAVGFGYDSSVGDYKLVRVPSGREGSVASKNRGVYVMTLNSNLWRRTAIEFPYFVDPGNNGQAVSSPDGNVYWFARVAQTPVDIVLVGFNLARETYQQLALPPNVDNADNLMLGVLGGCISVGSSNKANECFQIWIMKGETWMEFARFSGPANIELLRPLYVTPDGALLMYARAESYESQSLEDILLIYHPKTATCNKLQIAGLPQSSWGGVYVYNESAVSFS